MAVHTQEHQVRDYFYYNAEDGEDDHVHVEINGVHYSRIAEHGVKNIIKDGGWRLNGIWQADAEFIYNWGAGPTVVLRDGKVIDNV